MCTQCGRLLRLFLDRREMHIQDTAREEHRQGKYLRGQAETLSSSALSSYIYKSVSMLPERSHLHDGAANLFRGNLRVRHLQDEGLFLFGGFEQLRITNDVCDSEAG